MLPVLTCRVKDYYKQTQPADAVLMVCEDISAALGDGPNGTA